MIFLVALGLAGCAFVLLALVRDMSTPEVDGWTYTWTPPTAVTYSDGPVPTPRYQAGANTAPTTERDD